MRLYAPIYVTTATNIWAWQPGDSERSRSRSKSTVAVRPTLSVELNYNLVLAVYCLWLTYITFIQCLLHDRRLDLHYAQYAVARY